MMKGLVIWKDGHASLEEMKKPEISEYQALELYVVPTRKSYMMS